MKKCVSALSAVLGFVAVSALLQWPDQSAFQLGALALSAAAGVGFYGFLGRGDRRGKIFFGVLGAGLMLAFALGARLESVDRTGADGLLLSVLFAALWGPAAGEYLWHITDALEKAGPAGKISPRRVFWLSFAVIYACWLPVCLAYFPGCIGYDMNSQLNQVIHASYTTHHPLFHTLLTGAFYTVGGVIGSHTGAMFVCTLLQMAMLAASISYALSHLSALRSPRWVLIALTLFFSLAPQHGVMSIGYTKDVPFAALMLVSAVDFHKLFLHPARIRKVKHVLRLILDMVLLCLMRNNALYAVALFLIAALMLVGRGNRIRMLLTVLAALLLSTGINMGLEKATGAQKGLVNEMLSVPAQQLSRVYVKHGLEEPTSFEIIEWVPYAEDYRPDRSDFVKLHLKVRREGQLWGFIKFWAREALHFPVEYLDAFLMSTKGYWYPNDLSYSVIYGKWPEAAVGALITEQYDFGIEYRSFLPRLRQGIEYLFVQNHFSQIPGLHSLIHPSTYVWMLLWAVAWAAWRRRWAEMGMAALMLAYLCTLLLGPCVLVRYAYYLMLGAPVLCGALCAKKQ